MSRREDIDSSIWDDDDWLALPDDEKVVYLWSFTNSRIGMAGVYRVSRRAMSMETGKSEADLERILGALADKRYCFYDDGVMWVRSRIKHLRQKGSKIAKSIRGDLEKVAGHPFVERVHDEYATAEWVWEKGSYDVQDPTDTPSVTHASPIDTPSMGSGQGRAGQGRGKSKEDAGRAPEPPKPDELPADLPARLHPVAAAVLPALQRVADAKGAKPVTLAALGRTIAAEPDHDHPKVAGEFEHWWVHGHGASRPMRDVVLTYRKRLQDLPKEPAAAIAASMQALNGTNAMSRSERLRLQRADHDRRVAERFAEIEQGAA